jgi:hypothetical protein
METKPVLPGFVLQKYFPPADSPAKATLLQFKVSRLH